MYETQSYKKAMCKHSRRQCLACPCDAEYTLVNVLMMVAAAVMISAPFAFWYMGLGC
jgi:hypothetical protein